MFGVENRTEQNRTEQQLLILQCLQPVVTSCSWTKFLHPYKTICKIVALHR
jgi:hypothetical protein